MYDERLVWEGFHDKMTQMQELCLLKYRFATLGKQKDSLQRKELHLIWLFSDNVFLVHKPGIKQNHKLKKGAILNKEELWREPFVKRNQKYYRKINKELKKTYGANKLCPHWQILRHWLTEIEKQGQWKQCCRVEVVIVETKIILTKSVIHKKAQKHQKTKEEIERIVFAFPSQQRLAKMVLRQRKNKNLSKVVQEMDAFPKVPEVYVQHTTSGAASKKKNTFWSERKETPLIFSLL